MEENLYTVMITVYNRDKAYKRVGEILHKYADRVKLRIGYPFDEHNLAIIFLILEFDNDELGAFTGQLGQLPSVKVKANIINTSQK